MRNVNDTLFNKLRSRVSNFVTCWKVVRVDGVTFGFTSHDREFIYDGVTYSPENGIATDATVMKGDFSTGNTAAKVIFSQGITEHDVKGGLFDYAEVYSFWIDPYDLTHGIIKISRGNMGEITAINGTFTSEMRAMLDRLQLPFGTQYNLECNAKLGDNQCGVPIAPPVWATATTHVAHVGGDARIGGVVRPTVYNGFWYKCISGAHSTTLNFNHGVSYGGLGADIFSGTGINPFSGSGFGYLGPAFAALFTAQMAAYNPPGVLNITSIPVTGGATGGTEPVWPTVLGATIVDGELTWQAIDAMIVNGSVTGVFDRMQFQDSSRTEPGQTFQYGWIKWLTGHNASRVVEIRSHVAGPPAAFVMLEVMPYPITKGDTYQISWGCGKTRASCVNKFDNMLNFRGFPDMPTEDRALATPNFSTANQDYADWTDHSGGGKK
jgi:uncharacterized phage protein (TIGR02218 family)